MTHRDSILSSLSAGGALCDDCLALKASIHPRQTVNMECRNLERSGFVSRQREHCHRCGRVKIVNATLGAPRRPARPVEVKTSEVATRRPWYWEGNVQARIVAFLKAEGYSVLSAADTASRETGKDIVARTPSGEQLWISVKGYPERSRNTQARHWFSQAIFDVVMYRDEDSKSQLTIGLPAGFTTYENLSKRVLWLRRNLPFSIYWVSEDGSVSRDS